MKITNRFNQYSLQLAYAIISQKFDAELLRDLTATGFPRQPKNNHWKEVS